MHVILFRKKKIKYFDIFSSRAKSLEWFTTPSFCVLYTFIVSFQNGNIMKIKLAYFTIMQKA